jgi:SAM-dependent methyltransferase
VSAEALTRFAVVEDVRRPEFAALIRVLDELAGELRLDDQSQLNALRFPWSEGMLGRPALYASRLWEYPFALRAAGLRPGLAVADVGCGRSAFTAYLASVARCDVTAVDPADLDPEFFGRLGVRFLNAGMEAIPVESDSQDVVFSISVMEHVEPETRRRGMQEIARILKPGGRAIVTVDLSMGFELNRPLDLVWDSGLSLVPPVELEWPARRFGAMPDVGLGDLPVDVLGMTLAKIARRVETRYRPDDSPVESVPHHLVPTLLTRRSVSSRAGEGGLARWLDPSRSPLRRVPGARPVWHAVRRAEWHSRRAAETAAERASFAAHELAGHRRATRCAGGPGGITAVVVGRNDDYMPNFAERLRATIERNLRHLADEVVFVEWNPPDDRELLSYDLARRFPSLRAYVVPGHVHRRLGASPKLDLLEYHAKNAGIRRARAPWIVVTNADAAPSWSLLAELAERPLDPAVAWIADRVDVEANEGGWNGARLPPLRTMRRIPLDDYGCGDFILASAELWERAGGYDESLVAHRIGCDVRGAAQLVAHGARLEKSGVVLHLAHESSCTTEIQAHHGEQAGVEGVPYQSDDGWGLAGVPEEELAERVWRLG